MIACLPPFAPKLYIAIFLAILGTFQNGEHVRTIPIVVTLMHIKTTLVEKIMGVLACRLPVENQTSPTRCIHTKYIDTTLVDDFMGVFACRLPVENQYAPHVVLCTCQETPRRVSI